MKAHLHYRPNQSHQVEAMTAFADGLRYHGIVPVVSPDWSVQNGTDFVVCWGDKVPGNIELPRLILEAGYINGQSGHYVRDRLQFISAGWNGLHGRAFSGRSDCPPDRWYDLDIPVMPWREDDGEYVLICDQHPGDQCAPPDQWWRDIERQLTEFRVLYRPHPLLAPDLEPLENSLERAGLCITWSSTAAVQSVLSGVPTLALDRGSIAWDVTSHSLTENVYLGSVSQWAYNLAYRQWTDQELANGTAWEHLQYGYEANN